jgi:hypothetical protein
VPYGAVDHGDGEHNHGFHDLRDRPDLVVDIPETSKSTGLQNLLRVINAAGSPLMSIGCECGYFSHESASEGNPTGYVGSYVGVTFRDPARNAAPETLVKLAGDGLRDIKPSATHQISFEMLVEPLNLFFGFHDRFELSIRCFGHGFSEQEAWDAFAVSTNAAAESLKVIVTKG